MIGIGSAMVAAGTPVEAVMASIFGVVIAGSFIEMGVSQGLISMGGGYQAMESHTFASADNLIMSCTVLAIIVLLNRFKVMPH
ncbi:unnamed protein product [Oppiella nova]|uniref:Uncharacterized protein n=1 Tax=Oppiella nova TaxID=334625 RepID=A0A7R9L772_9ACAR|nr:unnamed protein product [Oppiella nova]CAG2155858.1 unnamed protein product [Oppiella nova]